jgi:hypothetical protein
LPQLLNTQKEEDRKVRRLVRKFINVEKPGMTNGNDALIEVYETYEEVEENEDKQTPEEDTK